MATTASDEIAGGRSCNGLSSGHRCQSSDALIEWRSSEQLENGVPSTTPPYWDTDDSDDDGGPKPSDLYGKHTWKIEKFSQVTKRELRSNPFEAGGYKWYILVYPQGCDVCNHLSLFLCVADHDKLLPGWSHFAQFTIAVVNKDPKKSKFSDTLHRFWKKEHDWGWKKFMELSKVSDGFVDADSLTIKAQVQVIRERADRPFRCLDCLYRRELVRVYLTNVEQICRRFVEERRGKLVKLIEDKVRWSSFCAFWLGMDQSARRRMSREKKDMILKVVVKHFFIEKEVTSTLVMDSLYSGFKALEGQSRGRKGKAKMLEGEETPPPIIRSEKDAFVLVDDVLLLLERAAMEPLPPKDDKGPQNRTKDGSIGEDFNKDSIERDERGLTELGRRTVEIFVLAHVFSSKIEVAYQEAVALRRQEELIREEEAAWLVECEQKAKRGAGEKDKKSKKKQGKQKRNNRKGKEKLKDEKTVVTLHDKQAEGKDLVETEAKPEKDDTLEDVSDVSDSADMLQPDLEDRDASPVNWDADISEIPPPVEAARGSEVSCISTVQNGVKEKRSSSFMDDSSSTCSTDSAPSVVTNGSSRSNSLANFKSQKSPTRGKNQLSKGTFEEYCGASEVNVQRCADVNTQNDASSSRKAAECNEVEGVTTSLQDKTKWPELNAVKKEDEVVVLRKKSNIRVHAHIGPLKEKVAAKSPTAKNTSSAGTVELLPDMKIAPPTASALSSKASLLGQQTDKAASSTSAPQTGNVPRVNSTNAAVPRPAEKHSGQQSVGLSRPFSAPLIPSNLPAAPAVSTVQAATQSAPLLSRSISAAGRLGPDPSAAAAPAYIPQSYRNAITGNSFTASSAGFTHSPRVINSMLHSLSFSQQPTLVTGPVYLSQAPERMDSNGFSSGISLATPQGEVRSGQSWMDSPQRDASRSSMFDPPQLLNDIPSFDVYRPMNSGSHGFFPPGLSTGTSGRQVQNPLADDFPHLDIINDLLDDEQMIGRVNGITMFQGIGNGTDLFNRQFTYATDVTLSNNEGSLGGSSRFNDRSTSYPEDGFHHDYTSGSLYDSVTDYIPPGNSVSYMNGQIGSVMPNQWQVLGPDLSMMGPRNSGVDGYSYNVPECSNMACGVNGYAMFRPSNGH